MEDTLQSSFAHSAKQALTVTGPESTYPHSQVTTCTHIRPCMHTPLNCTPPQKNISAKSTTRCAEMAGRSGLTLTGCAGRKDVPAPFLHGGYTPTAPVATQACCSLLSCSCCSTFCCCRVTIPRGVAICCRLRLSLLLLLWCLRLLQHVESAHDSVSATTAQVP